MLRGIRGFQIRATSIRKRRHNVQNNRAASNRLESTRDVAAAPVDFVVMRLWCVSWNLKSGSLCTASAR
mgnify:CR=1 FL=1